jgi:hypothetical protein
VDVEKRLLEDAESFAKEVTALDEKGFISRTLAFLGIPSKESDQISEKEGAAPEARPHHAAGPARPRRF